MKEVFKKVRNIVTHDFLVIVISDFHRYSPEVVKNIASIAQHNDVILCKVYDPLERNLPKEKIIAGDLKNQLVLDGSQQKVKENLQTGFDRDYQQFESQMKKHRIPVLLFDTVMDTDQQLKEILKPGRK